MSGTFRSGVVLIACLLMGAGALAGATAASAGSSWAGSSFCTSYSNSHALSGAPYDGVAACAGTYTGTVSYDGVVFDTDGWQCVELAARYFYVDTGLKPPEVQEARNVVQAYQNDYPQFTAYPASGGTSTFSSSIAAGDIISMWGGPAAQTDGHVAIVTNVAVSHGSGNIQLLEENGSASGVAYITVTDNQMSYGSPSYDGGYYYYTSFQWLTLGPGSVSAIPRDHSLLASWSASGGASYTATASPGGASCTTSGTSCAITGLENDVPYTVSVTASSSGLTSPPSTVTATPRQMTGDYLGAGYSDLAWLTANPGQPGTLWLFDGAHGFGTTGATAGWGFPEPGVAGDFLGNGTSEIAWFQPTEPGGSTGSIYLVSWNGANWQATLARGPGVGRPIWVGAGDFAGTGYDDLAWLTAGAPGQGNTLWLFDGAHRFATVGETTGWGTPAPGVVGDFNGNGRSEIAWFQPTTPNGPTGSIYLVSWNGSSWGAQRGRGPGVGTPVWVGAGDFAGTGYDDLAWLTANPGQPGTLWLFDGAHGFGTVGDTTGWGLPIPGVVGDFGGNRTSEIAWFQTTEPNGPSGTIYLVSWNGSSWGAQLRRGPGVGDPIFVASTSSSYEPPTVNSVPSVTLAAGSSLPSASATSEVPVTVSWTVTSSGGAVCTQAVQKSVDGGSTWTSLPAPSATSISLKTTLTPGKATLFRVRATGCGNAPSTWATSVPVTVHLLQENGPGLSYTTGWKRVACAECSGGHQEEGAKENAAVTIKVSGTLGMALVLTKGPSDGSATITGAGPETTISTHASGVKYRTCAYAYDWAAAGKRTVTVANLATPGHPDLQLDAIIVLT